MEYKITLVLLSLAAALEQARCEFKLALLHTNDMHSRFDETDAHSAPCRAGKTKCYGGFARVRTAVLRAREEAARWGHHSIFLNAGDSYQGSIYYTIFKWRIVADMIDKMGIDVMSLGNHEFDDGPAGLEPFVKNTTVPIVCANANLSGEAHLRQFPPGQLAPSKVLDVAGVRIGVIGYLTPDTKFLSSLGSVLLEDEVESVKKEARRLKAEGVNILIALGHSGYETDKKIAREVPDLDIVVGGHTNTFLYTGKAPDLEEPEGPYPTVVEGAGGRKVLVVQAYAYTKYLGKLDVTFDDNGEIVHSEGNPLLIDESITKDADVESVLLNYTNRLGEELKRKVGTSKVFLEADNLPCRIGECNFGNLVADAFVDANAKDFHGDGWTDAPIAFIGSGGLRSSMNVKNTNGEIAYIDLRTTMPFDNSIEMLTVTGQTLMEVLEHSVKKYDTKERPGRFLQYSGVLVEYDVSRPPGHRVVTAVARCGACDVPRYHPIKPDQEYNVMTTSYMAGGGDGYSMLQGIKQRKTLSLLDWAAVADYLKKSSPVWPEVGNRIRFVEGPAQRSSASEMISVTHLLPTLFTTLLLSFY